MQRTIQLEEEKRVERIRLEQAVVVEGKHDKIKLEQVVDAVILPTDGYRIFNNPDRMALLRCYAATTGLIILTDSDSAGFQIRNYLKGALPKDSRITHVYIPDIFGKERRKRTPSAEGKLGVEGMEPEILLAALQRAGVVPGEKTAARGEITRYDLFALGLSGGANSTKKRAALLRALDLPERLSVTGLLEVLNVLTDRESLYKKMKELEE